MLLKTAHMLHCAAMNSFRRTTGKRLRSSILARVPLNRLEQRSEFSVRSVAGFWASSDHGRISIGE
jgi:hypothetical protein